MEKPIPEQLDWVKARAECSPEHLFTLLSIVVESDAKAAQTRGGRSLNFTFSSPTVGSIAVVRQANLDHGIEGEAIVFERQHDDSISVTKRTATAQSEQLFVARPHVSVQGTCMFEINSVAMHPWQVSRMALEPLFFRYRLSPEPLR